MNFFEHQQKARNQSRWIILGFIVVTLLIVFVINALLLIVLATQGLITVDGEYTANALSILSPSLWLANAELLITSSAIIAAVIIISSIGKALSLRSGGGKVARDMGATIVTPDTKDALRRRLYNVVEEIALASGVPVPEVYVMENEPGINAFAAGYTPADAAIAVTQGTLEKLNRAELQGVIAHEFSHIFNGDMRINIKMIGVIFGIMVIAMIGRKFLHTSSYRSSRSKDNGSVVLIGIVLIAIGYIGLFFARWMKSALSRQREYLADASAVQFTRDPSSIAGALKKIAAYNHSSYLQADGEEVSHMLFGSGRRSSMFATHPPLVKRITRLEKGFKAGDIGELSKKLKQQEQREHVQAEIALKEQEERKDKKLTSGMFDVDTMINNIGNPEIDSIAAAAVLASSLSDGLSNAAHSLEWAPEVLFYCLLDKDPDLQEKQRLIIAKNMGDISENKLGFLLKENGLVELNQRLPLFDICFPSLKRRPVHEIEKILKTIHELALVDNKIDVFEYLLSRLVEKYLDESHVPNRSRLHGKNKLSSCVEELTLVISAVATQGQQSDTSHGLQAAQQAFRNGMESVGIKHKNLTFTDDWHVKLDQSLEVLNKLSPKEKKKLVIALAKTVLDDKTVVTEEQEMLRVICSLINVPLPILQSVQ